MKNPFSKSNNLKYWLIIHLGIPAILGISLILGAPPLRLNTQIMDLFPQTEMSRIAEADNVLSERNGRETVILFSSPVFEKAKNAAILFYNKFKDADEIENASLLFDSDVIAEITEHYFNYRFVIANDNTIELLESGNAEEIAMDALVMAYGAINYVPLTHLDKDPFLLTERGIREFLSSSMLSSGNLSVKDDVLAVQIDEIWHVILRMTLYPSAVSVANTKNNVIGEFYKTAALIKENDTEIEYYFSGAPFHGYESASGAQREITILSTISMSFVLLLFIFVFRSAIPVIFSVLDILISLFLGTAATFLIFREIHVFTFIFGTVLIGICIDYSVHFFIQWKRNTELKNGYEIRDYISKSMIMCFVSSVICYSAILFAPLPVFKQFSVFAIAGILSSFLTAYCIYPLLKLPKENKRQLMFPKIKIPQLSPAFRIVSVLLLAAIFTVILFVSPYGFKLENNLSAFYTMSPFLEKSEIKAAAVLNHGSTPSYYIISGSSAEETLINEELLSFRLEKEIAKGNLSSFMGASASVPSMEQQKRTYRAMSTLLPFAKNQYQYLGFPPEYEKIYLEEFAAGNNYLMPENAPSWTGFSNFWIGEINGYYYSSLMLFNINDTEIFKSIADEFDFVFLINMAEIINRDLDKLTRIIIIFFFAAFILVAVINIIVYPLKDSIKICLVPVLVVLAVTAVLSLLKISLGFLPIAAIILVFGMGLDFIIYMTGRKKGTHHNLTRFAVFLSFLTTALSFGLLSLSGFAPVFVFGVTIAAGLAAAFVFTMLLQGKCE